MANINYALATGTLNARSKGFRAGSLLTTAARTANAEALQEAYDYAISNNLELYIPPGEYEIYGTLNVNQDRSCVRGTQRTKIKQYKQDAPVVHVGQPLATPGGLIFGVNFSKLWLTYDGTAVAGGHALSCSALYKCTIKELILGNPYIGGSGTDGVARMGMYIDQSEEVNPSFSNTFQDIHIKAFTECGWHQFRDDYTAATGNRYANIYISAGGGDDQRDIVGVGNGYAAYFGALAQSSFDQFNIEWTTCREALHMEVCNCVSMKSVNFEGLIMKNEGMQDTGVFTMYQARVLMDGCMTQNIVFDADDNVQNPSFFRMHDYSHLDMGAFWAENHTKTGISNLAIARSYDAAGNEGVLVDHRGITFGPNHQIDMVSDLTYPSGTPGPHHSVLSDFNNSAPLVLADANATLYAYRTPKEIRVPATVARTIVLSRQVSSTEACRVPIGTEYKIRNTGAGTVPVQNYDASALVTIAASRTARFAFDGANWIHLETSGG